MMELVAAATSDEDDCSHIYTQTSRLVSVFAISVSGSLLSNFTNLMELILLIVCVPVADP